MAEFALGFTKTALAGTISRVKSAIDEEAQLKVRVQNDLLFITGEFEMMQSFLRVANAERTNNEVVLTWVKQIGDLAYDVEDCVEFVVHLDKSKSWAWLWRVLPACMAPPRLLDQAVAELRNLKTRVEDVSQRNIRYNLISDSGTSNHVISQPAAASATSAFNILSQVWEAAGKRSRTGNLKKLIMGEGSDLQVISVLGSTAQLESTHIITEAYIDQEICSQYGSRAWVKLMHPFNPDEFLKSLLTQLYMWPHPAGKSEGVVYFHTMENNLMMAELMQKMTDQRYLIVLEQVSTTVDWDFIRMHLPDSNNGSRVIVSTKKLAVAIFCTRGPYHVLELKHFSGDQYLCALFKKPRQFNGVESSEGPRRDLHLYWRRDEAREWTNKVKLVEREREVHGLDRLVQDAGVVSVWGFSGAGKSALVRNVYYHQILRVYENKNHCDLFRSFSWVNVPCPFDLPELSRRLFLDFHSDDLEAKETAAVGMMDGQDRIKECREFLNQTRYLIVIDGVQSIDDWVLIKDALLSEPTEGSIVVITNEASVAMKSVQHEDRVLNIKVLNDEAALCMFIKIAGARDSEHHSTPNEVELSKLIVSKCGGLPGVISAVGKYHQSSRRASLLEHIQYNYVSYLESSPEFPSLSGLFTWMQSYFDACSDFLRPCIFYLKVFTEGHTIRGRRLVRRWIAEAYAQDTECYTADENAEILFSKIVGLSVIKQPPDSKVMCQVNSFFRDYFFFHRENDMRIFALEGRWSPTSQRTGRHLTISSSWDRDISAFQSMDLSRLRSLTVYGEWMSFFSSPDMRLLRVLDLEDSSGVTDWDLEQIVKLFPRLKFLSLRGCIGVTHLPNSLGGLSYLQTLDIKNTSIVTLTSTIIKLQKLQYIRAGKSHEPCDGSAGMVSILPEVDDGPGTSLPPTTSYDEAQSPTLWSSKPQASSTSWLSKLCSRHKLVSSTDYNGGGVEIVPAAAVEIWMLSALHTLGVVNVGGAGGNVFLRDIWKFTQLRKLRLSGINRKNWQELRCTISGHSYLESLSLILGDNKEQQDLFLLDEFMPPKSLKSLKLFGGNVRVSPAWIKPFDNLKKVHLEMIVSTQEDIDSLVNLPGEIMFRRLCIKPIEDGELLCYGRVKGIRSRIWWGELTGTKILNIDCGSYRSWISFGDYTAKNVEVLLVHCSTTEAYPRFSGIYKLHGLKEVWLKGTYSEAVKEDLQDEVSNHPRKPVMKLEKKPRLF